MALSIETRFDQLKVQAETFLSAGFHKEIGQTAQQYKTEITEVISKHKDLPNSNIPHSILSLVETRIDFETQLKLLGINRDPKVIYKPKASSESPYVSTLKLITRSDPLAKGFHLEDIVNGLPEYLQPANPFEGIASYQEILKHGFAALPGGELYRNPGLIFEQKYHPTYLCLDKFLGNPRLTDIYKNSSDMLVGVLAKIKDKSKIID